MSVLVTEAAAAYAAEMAARAAAVQAEKDALLAAARDAVKAVLVKEVAGARVSLTFEQLGLKRVHADVDLGTRTGLVVWSDGTVHIGAQLEPGATWRVRLVRQDSGAWAAYGAHYIFSLVDLGAALAAG